MYYFHEAQLRAITSIFNLKQRDFSAMVFGREHVWPQRLCAMERLLVTDVIKICNVMHVPIGYFINLDETPPAIRDSSVRIPAERWKPITLDLDNFNAMSEDDSSAIILKSKLCEVLGISRSGLYKWLHFENFNMKVSQLIKMLNELNLPLSSVINDPNTLPSVMEPFNNYSTAKKGIAPDYQTQILQLRASLAEREREISELKDTIIALQQQLIERSK